MRSNAYLNIQNIDTYCSFWSILAKIYPIDNISQRVTKYKEFFNKINIGDIIFTNVMHITDVSKFERLNKNLSTNVLE